MRSFPKNIRKDRDMATALSRVDGLLLLNYVRGPVWFASHVTEADMRNLRKQIDKHLGPDIKVEPPPRKPNPLRGVIAGSTVEFVGYRDDRVGATDQEAPVFQPGEKLRVLFRNRTDEYGVVYSCVREDDYKQYMDNPDNVDGDELVAEEIRKVPKPRKGKVN